MNRVLLVCKPHKPIEILRLTKKESLEQLQSLVGGYIQGVKVKLGSNTYQAWVDEEGLLKQLDFNAYVSQACGLNIVGTAVIVLTKKYFKKGNK